MWRKTTLARGLTAIETARSSQNRHISVSDKHERPWLDPIGKDGLVSIVVPTRNRAQLLEETLESLCRQTYRPLQIIVINDGSDDDTERRVRTVQAELPHGIQLVYESQPQGGAPAARNLGASLSEGEFIVFMDDDDVASEAFIEARVTALNSNPAANLAFGTWQPFAKQNGLYKLLGTKGMIPGQVERAWDAFLDNWDLLLQGCVIRRTLVCDVGPWRTDLEKSQDLDYKARILSQASCLPVYSERGTVFYRKHDESISGKLAEAKLDNHLDVINQIEDMALALANDRHSKERLANYLWFQSFWLYGKGDFVRGYRQLKRAKLHFPTICRRKGLFPMLFDLSGLDVAIGPGYYFISQCKKALGLSRPRVYRSMDRLPTASC